MAACFLVLFPNGYFNDKLSLCLDGAFDLGFFSVGYILLCLRYNRCLIHLTKLKAVNDTLDFGCVLGTGDNIHRGIIGLAVPIPENIVKNAVPFSLLHKLFQILLRNGKNL